MILDGKGDFQRLSCSYARYKGFFLGGYAIKEREDFLIQRLFFLDRQVFFYDLICLLSVDAGLRVEIIERNVGILLEYTYTI